MEKALCITKERGTAGERKGKGRGGAIFQTNTVTYCGDILVAVVHPTTWIFSLFFALANTPASLTYAVRVRFPSSVQATSIPLYCCQLVLCPVDFRVMNCLGSSRMRTNSE